jgi:hypothetical protein
MGNFEIGAKFRAHQATGTSKIDEWHNQLHKSIDERIAAFGGGGDIKEAKKILADASQLEVNARLLGANGEEHYDEVLKKLNEKLPDPNKFV